jgi:hypothetical protein
MKYFLNDNWVNDSTITTLPTGATELSDSEWESRQSEPYVKTEEELAVVYKELRAEAYPSLTDQADMAYWDRKNGTTTLDDAIAAVKAEFPKP